jgi:hypothetical protein
MKGKEVPPQETPDGKKVLYHGTKRVFDEFETPTGVEKIDVRGGGVIYFTSNIKEAMKYAGPNGYVCIAEIENPLSYKEQRERQGLPQKKGDLTRNVYIALPENINIKEFKRVKDLD